MSVRETPCLAAPAAGGSLRRVDEDVRDDGKPLGEPPVDVVGEILRLVGADVIAQGHPGGDDEVVWPEVHREQVEQVASASIALDPLRVPAASFASPTTMFAAPAMSTVRRVPLRLEDAVIGREYFPGHAGQTSGSGSHRDDLALAGQHRAMARDELGRDQLTAR